MSTDNEVRCSVSNCQYWARGNYCGSSSILITHGHPRVKGTEKPADWRGRDSAQVEPTPITDIKASYCRTFIKKGPDASPPEWT